MKKSPVLMSAALFAAVMALSFTACAGGGENENAGGNGGMQAEALARAAFTIEDETVYGTLYDNSAGMDLLSRLPLSLEFSDYNNTEKIAYLPDGEELDTSDAPSSCDPAVGDITVYAPWGNIAIFYRDFGRSDGLVPLGRLDDGAIGLFAEQTGRFTVQISVADGGENGGTPADETEGGQDQSEEDDTMYITVNGNEMRAVLADNSSARALAEHLAQGDITIVMDDYGDMEKVGSLGFSLPRNDTPTATRPGDIILYQGNSLVIYYDTNSWNFTPIGRIEGISSREEMLSALGGKERISAILSLHEAAG